MFTFVSSRLIRNVARQEFFGRPSSASDRSSSCRRVAGHTHRKTLLAVADLRATISSNVRIVRASPSSAPPITFSICAALTSRFTTSARSREMPDSATAQVARNLRIREECKIDLRRVGSTFDSERKSQARIERPTIATGTSSRTSSAQMPGCQPAVRRSRTSGGARLSAHECERVGFERRQTVRRSTNHFAAPLCGRMNVACVRSTISPAPRKRRRSRISYRCPEPGARVRARTA